jgi:hypothetical protein
MPKRRRRIFISYSLLTLILLGIWLGGMAYQTNLLAKSRQQLSLAEQDLSSGRLKAAKAAIASLDATLEADSFRFCALPSIRQDRNELVIACDRLQDQFRKRLAATQKVLGEVAALIESGKVATAREKIRGELSHSGADPTLTAMARYVDRFQAQDFKQADDIIPTLGASLPEELTVDEFAKTLSRLVEMEKKANRESQSRIAAAVKSAIRSAARESQVFKPAVRGRVMVWDDTKGEVDMAYEILPDELRASARDSTVTIFKILNREQVVRGYYSISRQPGYQEKMTIGVVYWPQKLSPGTAIVWGGEPASMRAVRYSPEYGSAIKIKEWVASLPRR